MEDRWISLGIVIALVGTLFLLSRPSVRNLLSHFGFFLYAGLVVLLRASIKIVFLLFLLWLIGVLYPYVAHALGIPHRTVYELIAAATNTIQGIFTSGQTVGQSY